MRSNTSEQKVLAENFFKNNKNNETLEELLKISENIEEPDNIRIQAITTLKKLFNNFTMNNNYLKYKRNY